LQSSVYMAFVPMLVKSRGYAPGLRLWAKNLIVQPKIAAGEPGTPCYFGQYNDDSGSRKNKNTRRQS
jgi:hypothetical protein